MTQNQVDILEHSGRIWQILDEITGDPSLALLQSLNKAISEFAEDASETAPKYIRAEINAGENAEGLAQLIRQCFLVDYKTTSMETAELLAALGYKNSPLMLKLRENGGEALLARHIIVYRENNYVTVIERLSNEELSEGLLRAFFASFHARKCHIIPELIQNGVNSVFVEEFIKSLKPENIMDSISIVHAICFIIGSKTYRECLQLGGLMLELVKDFKSENLFDFKNEEVKLNKVDIEKQKYELQALEKRLKILDISMQDIERNVKVIQEEHEESEKDLIDKKKLLAEIKNVMIDLEEEINTKNCSTAQLEGLQSNYKGVENVYMVAEKDVSEAEQFIGQCVVRLKEKEQDKAKLDEMRQQIEEQQLQIQNIIDSEHGVQEEAAEASRKHVKQESSAFDMANYQTVRFSQVVFSELIKFPEGLKYFCNNNELGYMFALRLSQLKYSPQLIGCIELVSDMLLIETPARNNLLALLEGKAFVPYQTNDLSLFGSALSVPLVANLVDRILNGESEENLTYVYMFFDELEKIALQEFIATSFVGYKDGENFAITYLINALNRFMEIGLFEAIVYEILSRKDPQIVKCFSLLAAYVVFLVKLLDYEMYTYLHRIFSASSTAYENRYSTHEQLITSCRTLIAATTGERKSVDLNISQYTVYLTESLHQMSNKITNPFEMPVFARALDWGAVNIENYPSEPLKWNWEEINFFSNHELNDEFIRENKSHLYSIIEFIANKTPQNLQAKYQAPCEFVINSPVPNFEFDSDEFQTLLKDAAQHVSFLRLPVCAQTVRIQQICINFVERMMMHRAGIDLIKSSALAEFVYQEAGKLIQNSEYSLEHARIVVSLIGALSQSCCGVDMLEKAQIIDELYKIVYGNHISQALISQFIMCIAPASQECVDVCSNAVNRQLCECGHVCLRIGSQNDLKLTILAFLKSSDVRIRYEGFLRLAELLRKREFYLHIKASKCGCLCYGCAKIEQTQLLLNKDDASWALSCLMPLMNDVQAEIAIAALCVVEEFISKQDINLFIENQIDLKNWKNTGHFLQMRLAETPEGRHFIGKDQILALMDEKYIYRYTHNIEYKQFLSLTRQISSNLKYPSYDKLIVPDRNSADFQFTLQDQYAYDIIVLPHNTPFGRAALELPDSLENIPAAVRTSFWQDRSTYLEPATFSSSQSYSRGNIFECLNVDADGLNLIRSSGIVTEITQNLLSNPWKADSVLFRGYITAFSQISTTPAGFGLFEEGIAIFDTVCAMAISCQVERCRCTCFEALQILARNEELRTLLLRRFSVQEIRLRNFCYYLVTLRAPDAIIVYGRAEGTRPSIFSYRGREMGLVPTVQLMPDASAFYTEPTPLYTGRREESGIMLQDTVKTDFSALKDAGQDEFLRKNIHKDITNQFAEKIQELRSEYEGIEGQHLTKEAQQAIKLCLVDNAADAQAGLLALRQGYQKNSEVDLYLLLQIGRRHVELCVLEEIYEIIGNIDCGALEWLDNFEGEWM